MKREDLEKLRLLKQELDTLITEYVSMPKTEEVGDTYGDYRSGHKVIRVVRGTSTLKSDKLRAKIMKKQIELEERVAELEDYLDSVESPALRDVLRLYYARGLTQEEIGRRKNYSRQAITKWINDFWNERQE